MPIALIINPNTSDEMSASIRATASRVFQSGWSCRVVNAPAGPESLESWRDYQLAGTAILPLLQEHNDVDGVVLACFGDPGLYTLKEISRVPVVGISESSISMALLLGGKFGILAAMRRAVGLMDAMIRTYGVEDRYAGSVPLGMRVLDLDKDPVYTLEMLVKASSTLIKQGADVMLLGCAGLTSFTEAVMQRVPLTIIDPVEAGCRMLKTIVDTGLNTSHGGLYCRPAPQRFNHMERIFSPKMEGFLETWQAE